jgi:phosphatidylserine/phosphatidylglycerophosphate/cardiolipin synthase-like enzyme
MAIDAHIEGRSQLHAKYALLDSTIAIYGSANLTAHSWREQSEAVLAADDAGVRKQLREDFERLWAVSLPPDTTN